MIAKVEKKMIAIILSLAIGFSMPAGFAETAEPFLSIKDLAIPPSLGKIEDRFQGTGSRWVIHIQDVHAHLTAQQNIAAIVDHLNTVYGIRTIALEGGWSETSFPESWALPSSRQKQMLVGALLEDDYITGPAYAAIFSPTPITLVGIEDEKLYEKNRQIYVQHFKKRGETTEKIDAFSQKIAGAKETIFNPELKGFDRILMDYREGKKADKFIPAVLALADQKKAGLSDLDQIQIFKKAMEIERSIQKDKLESEAKRLEETYKRKRVHFEELLRANIIPKDKLEFYTETRKYLNLIKIQDAIKHKALFTQMEEAIRRLKEKLFASGEEKALDAESERLLVAKKILLFQATPDDLKVYEGQKEIFRSDLQETGLGEALDLALEFYRLAKKRDEIFFEKIMKDDRLQGDIAVVTGGFHTEGLSEQFAAKGISYLVITPDLGKEPANEKLYFERLGENPAGRQTLSEMRNRLNPEFDKRIAATVPRMRSEIPDIRVAEQAAISASAPRATSPNLGTPETAFDVKSLSPENLAQTVRGYLEIPSINPPTTPITIVTKRSELRKFLEKPAALWVWNRVILPVKAFTIIIVADEAEINDWEVIKTSGAKIQRVQGTDLEPVVERQSLKTAATKIPIAVIDPEYAERKNVFVVRSTEYAAALLLFLSAILEGHLPYLPEILTAAQNIILGISRSEATSRAA